MAVLIFKPIEKCNSNCLYCDTITKHQDVVMGQELLELLFRRIDEYLRAEPDETLVFTWHGGEICLLGADYLFKACELQDQLCSETKHRISHSVQSNLTLLTQRHVDAFKLLGVRNIGTSYEPIPHIRGMGPERDSERYNRDFYRAVALLEKNGVGWGVIYTAHRKTLERPLEIFNYLTNMNLGAVPQFNMVRSFDDDDERRVFSITDEEFANFLGGLFEHYWPNRERYGPVQPFSWYINAIIHRQGGFVCEMSGTCSHRWFFVGPEGEASHCGVSGDYDIFNYGSIQDRTIQEILDDKIRHQIAERQVTLPETHCKGCRFWGVCHGGCPVGAYMVHRALGMPAPSCGVTKIFLERYFEPITGHRVEFYPAPDATEQGG